MQTNSLPIWSLPIWIVAITAAVAHADRLELVHGGQVAGEVINKDREDGTPYIMRTEFGRVLVASDDVTRVRVQRDEQKAYERFLMRMPATADGNWRMAKWCKTQNLVNERRHHLRETIRLDSDHAAARKALNYVLRDGKWETRHEIMEQRGFVRHKGQWRLPQDIAIEDQQVKQRDAEREYRNQLKDWNSWIGKKRENEAYAKLDEIVDPTAVPALVERIHHKRTSHEFLVACVDALGRIASPAATRAIVDVALQTPDEELRLHCLDKIQTADQVELAASILVFALDSKDNKMIHSAAKGLSHIGAEKSVRNLIDALVTKHKLTIGAGQEGRINPTFSRGPSGSSNGISMGGKPRIKIVELENRPVLEALLALTNVNFEFDQTQWRQWYENRNLPERINLRRDS